MTRTISTAWQEFKTRFIDRLAEQVTHFLSPVVVIPAYFIFLIVNYSQTAGQAFQLGMIIFGLGVLPIILWLIYLKKTHRITDWDVTKRQERYRLNIIALIWGILMWLIFQSSAPLVLTRQITPVLVWLFLFTLITFKWKISAHSGAITLVTVLISLRSGGWWWSCLTLIPLVSWSRIYRHNHNWWEIVGGIGVATVAALTRFLI